MYKKQISTFLIGTLLLLVIIVTVIVVSIRQTAALQQVSAQIKQAVAIQDQVEKILTLSIDNETGARGFLLTGDTNFLVPFDNAKQNLYQALDSLKRMEGMSKKAIVDSLALYAGKRLEFSKMMVEIRQVNSLEESIKKYNAADGRNYMDRIRYFINRLATEQQQLLKQSHLKSNDSYKSLTLIQYIIIGTSLILIIVLGIKFRNETTKVKKALENFVSLVDAAPDATVIVDGHGLIFLINQQAEELFGYHRDELLKKPVEQLIPTALREAHSKSRKAYTKNPHTRAMGSGMELFAIKKDGQSFPVEISLAPVKTELGTLVSASIRDITERKVISERIKSFNAELETKVAEQTIQIRSILESISDAFMVVNPSFIITYINKTAAAEIKIEPENLIGKDLTHFLSKEDHLFLYDALTNAYNTQKKVQAEVFDHPTNRWLQYHLYPNERSIAIYVRDISEKKQGEKDMQQANEDLRRLSAHLQQIREEERKTIARDLHDDLGQQLTGLQMDVHWLQKRLQDAPTQQLEKINEINEMVNNTIRSVRRILSDLRPAILDDLGMLAAMEWLNLETSKRYSVEIVFQPTDILIDLSPDTAAALFRIYQEAMNNAIKHANAKTIQASVQVIDDQIELYFKDNGKGMVDKSEGQKGYGLLGIKERTYILGGSFSIQSELGKGTSLTIRLPIHSNGSIKDINSR